MVTARTLSFTTLVAMAMGAGSVSLAEEVKDSSTTTEIVNVEGSDLRNEDALRVAVGDFDDVEFLLSAEGMEAIADNVYISFNGVSAKGGEGSGSSSFSAEASGQVEATENSSTTFSGALTLASKTNTSDAETTGVGAVAMSLSSDDSTEQYATCAGKSYYEQVSTSSSGSAVTTYSATSFLGNFDSVGYTDGSYGTSAIDSGIVPFAASDLTWTGDGGENNWSGSGNWNGSTWSNGDNATFDATGSANSTVTVDENITAAKITVTGNTSYTFEYASDATTLEVSGAVTIGNSSGDNSSLTIAGGTNTFGSSSNNVCLGYSSNSTGYLYISGGTNTFKGAVRVGNNGTGYLTITDGTNTFSNDVFLGYNSATSTGTITITGGTNTFSGSGKYVYVGYKGTGKIEIKGGTNTFSNTVYLGGYSTNAGTGTIEISGGTNKFSSELYLAYTSGSYGYLTIGGGDNTFSNTVYVAYSSGSVESALTITGETTSNTFNGSVEVGHSGTGTMTIENGKNTFNGTVYLGRSSSSSSGKITIKGGENTFNDDVYLGSYGSYTGTGTIEISGGTNKFGGSSKNVYVGYNGTGTMEISGGTNTFESTVYVGNHSTNGNGTITITGGENTFKSTLTIGASGSYVGTVKITGGTTTISGSTTIYNGSSLTIGGSADSTATVYLETKIGTTATGSVVISDYANIILSGALLDSVAELANGATGSVAVIMANTISFGDVTLGTGTYDLDSLVNSYVSAEGYQLSWDYYDNTLYVVSVKPIPEPSMFGMLLGLGALGLVATRRRRRKA